MGQHHSCGLRSGWRGSLRLAGFGTAVFLALRRAAEVLLELPAAAMHAG